MTSIMFEDVNEALEKETSGEVQYLGFNVCPTCMKWKSGDGYRITEIGQEIKEGNDLQKFDIKHKIPERLSKFDKRYFMSKVACLACFLKSRRHRNESYC